MVSYVAGRRQECMNTIPILYLASSHYKGSSHMSHVPDSLAGIDDLQAASACI